MILLKKEISGFNFIIFLCSVFIVPSLSFAEGPWTLSKDKTYMQFTGSFNTFNTIFNADGESVKVKFKTHDNTFQYYTEYGLTNKATLKIVLPFKVQDNAVNYSTNDQRSGNLDGLSNLSIGGKYLFWDKEIKIAGGLDVFARTYSVNQLSGLRTGYAGYSMVPYITIGKRFNSSKLQPQFFDGGSDKSYVFMELGAGIKSHKYSNDLRVKLEGGYTPIARLWFAGVVDLKVSFKNGSFEETDPINYSSTSLYVNNQEYVSLGLKTSYAFTEGFGINGGIVGLLGGRNIATSPSVSAGIFLKWE